MASTDKGPVGGEVNGVVFQVLGFQSLAPPTRGRRGPSQPVEKGDNPSRQHRNTAGQSVVEKGSRRKGTVPSFEQAVRWKERFIPNRGEFLRGADECVWWRACGICARVRLESLTYFFACTRRRAGGTAAPQLPRIGPPQGGEPG